MMIDGTMTDGTVQISLNLSTPVANVVVRLPVATIATNGATESTRTQHVLFFRYVSFELFPFHSMSMKIICVYPNMC